MSAIIVTTILYMNSKQKPFANAFMLWLQIYLGWCSNAQLACKPTKILRRRWSRQVTQFLESTLYIFRWKSSIWNCQNSPIVRWWQILNIYKVKMYCIKERSRLKYRKNFWSSMFDKFREDDVNWKWNVKFVSRP